MEDRFQFRVYEKKSKRMIDNVTNLNPLVLDKKFNEYADEYTLMQCTGLKDKNGKLIFEGDIVEIVDEEENAIIKWEDDTANFSIHILNENVIANFDNFWSYQLEVLGNIYEDKYLLGEEN